MSVFSADTFNTCCILGREQSFKKYQTKTSLPQFLEMNLHANQNKYYIVVWPQLIYCTDILKARYPSLFSVYLLVHLQWVPPCSTGLLYKNVDKSPTPFHTSICAAIPPPKKKKIILAVSGLPSSLEICHYPFLASRTHFCSITLSDVPAPS